MADHRQTPYGKVPEGVFESRPPVVDTVMTGRRGKLVDVHALRSVPADPESMDADVADRDLEVVASFSMDVEAFVHMVGGAVRSIEQETRPPSPGRNQPCPCGSGKKYKHCHGR